MAFNVFFLLYFGLRVSLSNNAQSHEGACESGIQGKSPTNVCSHRQGEAQCFQGRQETCILIVSL